MLLYDVNARAWITSWFRFRLVLMKQCISLDARRG